MAFLDFAIKEIIKRSVTKVIDRISLPAQRIDKSLQPTLEEHLAEVARWSDRIELYGLSRARSTDDATIELSLLETPKKFRKTNLTLSMAENHILCSNSNFLLIGDPGAGKTTTIKRLARRLLFESSNDQCDTAQYPIIIRLRNILPHESLFQVIADKVGISWEIVEHKVVVKRMIDDKIIRKLEIITEIRSNGKPIKDVIISFLNATGAFLFADGLDEVHHAARDRIEDDLATIAINLSHDSRMLVSTRSGDFTRNIPGLDVLEIAPLSDKQILEIASKWLDTFPDFLRQVARVPYSDVLCRPLSLMQLIIIYDRDNELPEQPSSIYRRFISLYLEDWDYHRRIKRHSKYAGFPVERKLDFLSAMAFYLMIDLSHTHFTGFLLEKAYRGVYESFGLPKTEARDVAREIETHTGIIIEVNDGEFEFSHLSMQEYLCALHMIKLPHISDFGSYLYRHSSVVAVAIAISPNPSQWMASIFMDQFNYKVINDNLEELKSFFSRLVIERPFFARNALLGLAIIKTVLDRPYDHPVFEWMKPVMEYRAVALSISDAFSTYFDVFPHNRYGYVRLILNCKSHFKPGMDIKLDSILSKRFYDSIKEKTSSVKNDRQKR